MSVRSGASGPVLVTGAGGFAGRYLVAEMGEDGIAAAVDVTDADEVSKAVDAIRPAAVVHLAARTSVAASWQDVPDVWRVNALGTVNILEAVRAKMPAARVLAVSSAEVYGRAREIPTSETAPLEPLSPYAGSKAAAEIACAQARLEGLDVVVVRPFPHTGPGQDERFAIGSWTRQIARLETRGGGALTVGNLSVERDITDVRDVARAYRLLLDPDVPAGTYNIASGRAVTMQRVVELLVAMAQSSVVVEHDAARMRPADIPVLCGDASRLTETTGWRPGIPLEETLADTLHHARELVKRESVTTA